MVIDPTNQVSGQFSDFSHKGINSKIIARTIGTVQQVIKLLLLTWCSQHDSTVTVCHEVEDSTLVFILNTVNYAFKLVSHCDAIFVL